MSGFGPAPAGDVDRERHVPQLGGGMRIGGERQLSPFVIGVAGVTIHARADYD